MRVIRRGLAGSALVWGGIVNGFLAGNLLFPHDVPLIMVLNHIAPWITLLSLVVFALAVTLRASPRLLLWVTPGVIAFVWWYAPAWLPTSPPDATGIEFTAATFNVWGHIADPARTFAVIRDMDADLVALHELRPNLEEKLQQTYPYHISKAALGYDVLALFSRFPLLEHEATFDETQLKYLRAVVDLNGRPVVVYVIHPPIPQPDIHLDPWYKQIYRHDDTDLQIYLSRAINQMRAETLPMIMLCDCNATPRSRQYALLDHDLNDAFGAVGWGLGLTHPVEPFPLLRIDYVWYSDQFTALEATVWPDAGTSDHFPVWARLVLRGE